MYKYFLFIGIFCFTSGCKNEIIPAAEQVSLKDTVQVYEYDSLSIPSFFEKLIVNHQNDFSKINKDEFVSFCEQYDVNPLDSLNSKKFYTIKILHDLFTSQTASNGSKGEILNIPYMWHWVSPNPRHEIAFKESKVLIKDTKAPKDFSKYASYTDIDRTPYLFLTDLMAESPKYYTDSFGEFSTFGWCSEREMAFVCLLEMMGFDGKVMAEGNHSWSEFLITMNLNDYNSANFMVKVDNTFDTINWETIENNKINEWRKNFENASQARWYNQQAHLQSVQLRLRNYVVPNSSMERIENEVVKYLKNKLSVNN